jgi:SAM-dependent methyltransferase
MARSEYLLTYCSCGDLIYISPTPDSKDLKAVYVDLSQFGEGSVYSEPGKTEAILAYMEDRFRAIASRLGRTAEQKCSVLEIGAGLAWMARVAKQFNSENITIAQDISAEGLDKTPWVDRYVQAPLDCEELDNLHPFDIISVTHVIEHLVDPLEALQRLARLLQPNGILFVTAPHRPEGWQRTADISTWIQYPYNHVPAHLQYFSQAAMQTAAKMSGLDMIHWDATHEGGQAFETWLTPSSSTSPPPDATVRVFSRLLRWLNCRIPS